MNKWGFGEMSDTSEGIIAATVPERVSVPSTEIDPLTGNVVINWDIPYNNGAEIIAYHIEALAVTGIWKEIAQCDGSSMVVVQT